ncbi:MAG: hypothetical protein K6A63_01690 [Acholeplasmatales bacterium]|nr:hypothetical protein [Acholeplasmatales bacterium]
MKFKSLTKLALSGVALAAVAATLGTSTYAWYVSNAEATVAGVNGATAGSTSGNLLVSQVAVAANEGKVTETGAWGSNLSSVSAKQTPNLNPVTKDTTGEGGIAPETGATGWHDKDNAAVAKTSAYGYYAFGVWSTDKVAADMAVGVANTTTDASFKYQTAYTTEGLNAETTSIGVNDSFTVDFLQAIRVEIFLAPLYTGDSALTLSAMTTDTYSLGEYCPADTFYKTDFSGAYALKTISGSKFVTGGNAHTYYNAVLGKNAAGGITPAATDTLTSGKESLSLPKNTNGTTEDTSDDTAQKYVVVLKYWLEGTDTDCFDSCGGQSFAINLKLTAK